MEERFLKFDLFSKFPEVTHGISFRSFGDMRFGTVPGEEVIKNRLNFFKSLGIKSNQVIVMHQVHGDKITNVGEMDAGKGATDPNSSIPGADGLITAEKNIFLMLKTADCLPVFLYDPTLQIVAAVHAGWRGILNQIILRALDKFVALGTNPEDLIVGVGPGICQKHFIVKGSVLKDFLASYPASTFVRNKDGYVDLKKAVLHDLKKGGVLTRNIEVSKYCTACDNGIFGSFRKEGTGAPEIASIIGIK
jgi:hypothetical protein